VWTDGERAARTGIAVQENDLWHVGSLSKSMTATLVARLADSGALHWDETVSDILGAVAPDMREGYRAATFRHLLWHRSGLPKEIASNEIRQFSYKLTDVREERKAYASKALALPQVGPTMTTYHYSNAGYVIAGAMLEAKLGSSWEDLIRRHLFEPLGLRTAGFGAPGGPDSPDQPAGHNIDDKGVRWPVRGPQADNPVVSGPSGRVHMSLPDLLMFLGAHRDRGAFLRRETWDMLHTPPASSSPYAMGWFAENGVLWNSGTNGRWYAEAQIDGETIAAAACNDYHDPNSTSAVSGALRAAARAAWSET
jgi:CubicO group peptidase (beta-lactamase class C family)